MKKNKDSRDRLFALAVHRSETTTIVISGGPLCNQSLVFYSFDGGVGGGMGGAGYEVVGRAGGVG